MEIAQRRWSVHLGWSEPLDTVRGDPDIVLAFGGRGVDEPLVELGQRFAGALCIGCSTAGEIYGAEVDEDGLVVAFVWFDAVRAKVVAVDASEAAGLEIAGELNRPDLRHVFVLSDGLQVNGTALARGLREGVSSSVVVTGGLAGDGGRFESTWVWDGSHHGPGRVVALGLYGDALVVEATHGGGWRPFGVERVVTAAEGNVLHALDGRPALALYEEYLGELADELPAAGLMFPLALQERHGQPVVRTLLAIDREAQTLTFAGDLPVGTRVRLMRTHLDRLVDAVSDAVETVAFEPGAPVFALVVSCVGRRLVLVDRVEEEVEAVEESLPRGSRILGFYSYGELSPTSDGTCDLHNQTLTLTTWRERG